MAERTVVRLAEPVNPDLPGVRFRLEIDRSAAGAPRGLVSVIREEDGRESEMLTVVLEDLRDLRPALEWAEGR